MLEYELPGAERVELVIYNLLGQQVRSLVSATRPPGRHRAVWRGENDAGETVTPGSASRPWRPRREPVYGG